MFGSQRGPALMGDRPRTNAIRLLGKDCRCVAKAFVAVVERIRDVHVDRELEVIDDTTDALHSPVKSAESDQEDRHVRRPGPISRPRLVQLLDACLGCGTGGDEILEDDDGANSAVGSRERLRYRRDVHCPGRRRCRSRPGRA